jgi:hypothetical protein
MSIPGGCVCSGVKTSIRLSLRTLLGSAAQIFLRAPPCRIEILVR